MTGLKVCPQCGNEFELDQRFCPQDGSTLRLRNETGDLVGSIIADRYHVLRKLGEGGMGQVYLAEHVKMGRKSALKVMNPSMVKDADAISRFNREAANASRISHPHVASVYDFGETPEGVIYLAMEFVDGPPLTKLIEQEGALTPHRAAEIARQTADALAVAHDMGIVHRDLKPDNIMITRNRDGSDCVKVVDFGIAKAADNASQKVTKTGLVVGTPEYMSPEQLAGDKLDGRSDIYALALVAFNMLTGKLPFPAETVQESMIMRLTERPRKLSEMRPDVAWPGDVQAVLDKALERDASLRYQSASEMGKELSRAVSRMSGAGAVRGSGTQLLSMPSPARASDAIPPTKVGGGDAPATRVSNATPKSEKVSRRRNIVMIASVVSVIVIAASAYSARLIFGSNSDSTSSSGRATQRDTAAERRQADSTRDAESQRLADLAMTRTLDSLENIVSDSLVSRQAANGVIAELDVIGSRLHGDDQAVHAKLVRAMAETLVGNQAEACGILRGVADVAKRTRFKNRVAVALERTACPNAT